jgi:hypothetical protein
VINRSSDSTLNHEKLLKKILLGLLALMAAILVFGLVLSFLPSPVKVHHQGISPEEAAELRATYSGPHKMFATSDGETLSIRQWDPDTIEAAKKDMAVLIFHGITAYSGAYEMAALPFAEGGYTLGHSLGVAAAMCVADAIPEELAGVILLSGAYEYYREGMLGMNDPLFNYKYTLRFLTMLDVTNSAYPKA